MVASAQLLDVSNWQGPHFDWDHAKATIPNLVGGIFRLTQGLGGRGTNSPDPTAQHNFDALQRLGLWPAAYHFMDPALDGGAQSSYFTTELHKLGQIPQTLGQFLDNETAKAGISADHTSKVAQAFMTERQKLSPFNPNGIYSFIDFIKWGYCDGLAHYPLWLAFPSSKAPMTPMPWTKITFWQWGQRNGIDADAFMGTVTDFHAWVASYAPKHPAAPQMHRLNGLKTLGQVAKDFGVTVPEIVRATSNHTSGPFSAEQRHLWNHLDDVHPLPGTEIWIP